MRVDGGFLNEMMDRVLEETPLFAVRDQIVDYVERGETVTHGPFSASECAELLTRWFDRGWLVLIAFNPSEPRNVRDVAEWDARATPTSRGDYLVLRRDDARSLLMNPNRWDSENVDGGVMLCISDEGELHPRSEWISR